VAIAFTAIANDREEGTGRKVS